MAAFAATLTFVAATFAAALTVAAFVAAALTAALAAAAFAAALTAALAAAAFAAALIAAFALAAFALMAVTFVVATAAVAVVARRFVLVEAGAAAATAAIAAAGPSERAAGAEREEPNGKKCRQTLLHERSFCRELWLVMSMARLATMLGLVAVVGFAAFTAVAFAAVAFTALAFAAVAFTAFAFATVTAFFYFFAGAFIEDMTTFAMNARRFVLVEACAGPSAAPAAGQCQGAAGAEDEQSGCEEGSEALPEKSLGLQRAGPARPAHRPQLHSVECQRVERGTPVAKHVGDVLEVIGEAFVFV